MPSFNDLSIYKELNELSKELRKRIRQMPKEYKFEIGNDMKKLLRRMRYQIYLINSHDNSVKPKFFHEFINMQVNLKIHLDECIEDNIFTFSGKFSIALPLKRLTEIRRQTKKWLAYTESYNKGKWKDGKTETDECLPF